MALHALQAPPSVGRGSAPAWPLAVEPPSPLGPSDRGPTRARVLTRDDGRRLLLVVAEDRGPGDLAGRALAALASTLEQRSVEYLVDLLGVFESLPERVPVFEAAQAPARAALLAVSFDRHRGAGFGACLGDGGCFLLQGAEDRLPRRLNPRNRRLLAWTVREGRSLLQMGRPDSFGFQAIAGQVLVTTASGAAARRLAAGASVHDLAARAWQSAEPPDRDQQGRDLDPATRLIHLANVTAAVTRL